MKSLKLSKTSWLILSAGVFVVILAGLGLTRSQQLQEQSTLDEEISLTETRLSKIQVNQLNQQLEEFKQRADESETQLTEAKDRLRQNIESDDTVEEFFVIANYCGVEVMKITTSVIATDSLEGVECSHISLNASVDGELLDLVNFIISLNDGYTTGIVNSAGISIPESSEEGMATADIKMTIYSYDGD